MTKQPERSVDEIVDELVDKLSRNIPSLIPTRDELDAMKKNIHREIRQELTQTLQAERQKRDEMVEAALVEYRQFVLNTLDGIDIAHGSCDTKAIRFALESRTITNDK